MAPSKKRPRDESITTTKRAAERARSGASPAPAPRVLVARDGCTVTYFPAVLSAAAAAQLFEELRDGVAWRRETDAFGPQDRETFYCGDARCTFACVGGARARA